MTSTTTGRPTVRERILAHAGEANAWEEARTIALALGANGDTVRREAADMVRAGELARREGPNGRALFSLPDPPGHVEAPEGDEPQPEDPPEPVTRRAWLDDARAESPHRLFQEALDRGDPHYGWRVLVGCVLVNRARGDVARPAMEVLFDRWPTPADLAAAREAEVLDVVRPLGFVQRKARSLIDLSAAVARGETLLATPGVGPYALEAHRMFVSGQLPERCPDDKRLAAYWRVDRAELPVRRAQRHLIGPVAVLGKLDR